MTLTRLILTGTLPVLLLAAAGCENTVSSQAGPVTRAAQAAPEGAPPGSCWERRITPAVIETVTLQEVDRPAVLAADGSVLQPATYRTETRQQIVRPRSTVWTETPCPAQMTPEFIASVQRALAARGYFSGIATGRMDGPTLAAIRLYQADQGIEASTLTLDAARKLGLIAIAG